MPQEGKWVSEWPRNLQTAKSKVTFSQNRKLKSRESQGFPGLCKNLSCYVLYGQALQTPSRVTSFFLTLNTIAFLNCCKSEAKNIEAEVGFLGGSGARCWELDKHMTQFRNCEVKIRLPDMVSRCYSHSEDNDHLEEGRAGVVVGAEHFPSTVKPCDWLSHGKEKKKNKILFLHFQFLLALFILLCTDVDEYTWERLRDRGCQNLLS